MSRECILIKVHATNQSCAFRGVLAMLHYNILTLPLIVLFLPSTECPKPKLQEGVEIKCTNGNYVDSICEFSCRQGRVIEVTEAFDDEHVNSRYSFVDNSIW